MPQRKATQTKPSPGPLGTAWHLLSDEDLNEERNRLVERHRRLMEIAAAINASDDPDRVLRLVRDAVVDSGMFDRAGVWIAEPGYFRGAWGTDPDGALRDEHNYRERAEEWGPLVTDLVELEKPYVIKAWVPQDERIPAGTPVHHAVVALRAGGELLGVLSVDNYVSGRPVLEADVRLLIPFADMASAALRTARMMRERDRLLERQRVLMRLAAGMNASLELDEILQMVRDAVVEAGDFDRAGVFTVDSGRGTATGAWGTDREGRPVNITQMKIDLADQLNRPFREVALGLVPYRLVDDLTNESGLPEGHHMHGVRAHAVVPMRTSGEIVGVVCVDNLLSDRPIRESEIPALLAFAEQAALAVKNARLFQDLREAQAALSRAQKLRALGELAGGVAHNINNLLTAVLGYAELIRQQPESPEKVKRYAGIIERAGMDGAEIVRRVQQFARKETSSEFSEVDLGGVVAEAIDLTRPQWHDESVARSAPITLTQQIEEDVVVSGIASELREVVVNLLKNAADAMPEGGRLTVVCRSSGTDATLEVSDTGTGMDDATRERIFEPFFTTKGPALGLGLGLSMAWGIVVRHNGAITVDSRIGRGTRFRVTIPHAAGAPAAEPDETSGQTIDSLRVLLVDDEPLVLDSLSRVLAHSGAQVRTAESGSEALAWLETNASQCDIVLTDHGMPGLSGLSLLESVRQRFPSIHRVLISGWGAGPPGEADLSAAEVILRKPVARAELVRALADLVGSRQPAVGS